MRQNISLWEGVLVLKGQYIRTSNNNSFSGNISLWECVVVLKGPSFVEVASKPLLGLVGLLGEEYSLDVWQYTTLGNGHSREKLVQLLVITDGQLQVTGDDPGLLVVTGSIACQFKNFSGQVLHDSGQVHWGTGSNSLSIVSLAQVTVDTSHGELKTSTGRPGLALALGFASFTTSRHDAMLQCSYDTRY